jgi:aspartate kinase
MALVVHKYGGTSVGSLDRIQAVAQRCIRARERGDDLVVVVSAMAGETNRLLGMARELSSLPSARETDVLVATGEQVSVALLAIAIQAEGGKAFSFLADQFGIRTDNRHGRARIVSVDDRAVQPALADGAVCVVAGFQGVDADGNITTLGRGGSDTSAVALAAALGAESCVIHTDVDGIYTTDPGICADARKIDRISYEEMLELASLGAKVLQVRSVEFALNHNVRIHVCSSFTDLPGSWVVPEDEAMEKVRVRGIACDRDTAKITVQKVPDRPGTAAMIFEPLAEAGLNVDIILQNVSEHGTTDVTFTVPRSDLAHAERLVAAVVTQTGAAGMTCDAEVAKVSLVGVGIRSHSGVAARAFKTLADAGINIQMIATSEIKISCVVAETEAARAVQLLHDVFNLGAPTE